MESSDGGVKQIAAQFLSFYSDAPHHVADQSTQAMEDAPEFVYLRSRCPAQITRPAPSVALLAVLLVSVVSIACLIVFLVLGDFSIAFLCFVTLAGSVWMARRLTTQDERVNEWWPFSDREDYLFWREKTNRPVITTPSEPDGRND
ncbi:hypothetical protein [Planctomicrobium sp. SH664]|uniref:hypothetical protein n=1 Tax=Planctomicrobium sp. SH664 TaxID=3448125 RepID=UPI003F5CA58F